MRCPLSGRRSGHKLPDLSITGQAHHKSAIVLGSACSPTPLPTCGREKAVISSRPLMNSDRFLYRESIVYARATFAGSRLFQASSARRTFCIAVSRVNGGNGGRAGVVGLAMILLLEFMPSAKL